MADIEFLKTTLQIVAWLIAIIGGIFAAVRWGRRALRTAWRWLTRRRPTLPRETVRMVPKNRGALWSMGTIDNGPAMHARCDCHVTNIFSEPVRILRTHVISPRKARTEDSLILVQHPTQNIFGNYPILPGDTTELTVTFSIQPPFLGEGQDLKATLVFIDQFGNEHKLKNVVFRGPKAKEPEKPEPLRESIHTITDPIEKDIVAVLKAETNRYRECGRRVGGLGSIQTTYKDQTMRGVGTEWREADSPKNQSIVPSTEGVSIQSDNATALLNRYRKLSTGEERSRFVHFLLKRLSRNTEYAPVGYLILLMLFRIDRVRDALKKAKQDLKGDPAYGFSDFLCLLDALLRFEHPSFTTQLFDEVEKFLEGMDEYKYRIEERIAAIRTLRLAVPSANLPTPPRA